MIDTNHYYRTCPAHLKKCESVSELQNSPNCVRVHREMVNWQQHRRYTDTMGRGRPLLHYHFVVKILTKVMYTYVVLKSSFVRFP